MEEVQSLMSEHSINTGTKIIRLFKKEDGIVLSIESPGIAALSPEQVRELIRALTEMSADRNRKQFNLKRGGRIPL